MLQSVEQRIEGAVVMLNSEKIELMQEVMRSLALEYNWSDVFPK